MIDYCTECGTDGTPCSVCETEKYLNPVDFLTCDDSCPVGKKLVYKKNYF